MKSSTVKIFLSWTMAVSIILGSPLLQAADSVDAEQAQIMNQQGALLLDVREQSEYSEVHAPNATLIPLGELKARLNEITSYKSKPIAVMCHSGRRSARAVKLLERAGYSQVSNVNGGIVAWEKAGLEVIRQQ